MRDIIKTGLALFAITAIFTVILAATNLMTSDVIAQAQNEGRRSSMIYVLPEASAFADTVDLGNEAGLLSYTVAFSDGVPVGVIMEVSVTGFSPNLIFLVGVNLDGAVTGLEVLSHSETPGLGARITEYAHREQFIGSTGNIQVLSAGQTPGVNEVVAITGATHTMNVVTAGVNEALIYINNAILPNISSYSLQ